MYLQNNTLLQGGKYKIVRFISSGGFGCTYEAINTTDLQRVAIKELFVKDISDRDEHTLTINAYTTNKSTLLQKVKRKFLEEANALKTMSHPNIVCVYDCFEENGTAYYVMDYIEGMSLYEIIKRYGALTEQKTLKYIMQIADALAYVHGRKRLHLDIKPGNIMIDNQDNAILIDFGVSKQYDEVNGENTSTLIGKAPGYSPIEQLGNNLQQFSPATDIYALGATLYKCITGKTPPDATIVLSEGIPSLPATISVNICNTIKNAMAPIKANRPQSIDSFKRLLNLQSKPSVSKVVSQKESTGKSKNDSSSSILWMLIIVVVALGVYFILTPQNDTPTSESIHTEFQHDQDKVSFSEQSKNTVSSVVESRQNKVSSPTQSIPHVHNVIVYGYNEYFNERFKYRVKYPNNLKEGKHSFNGDGCHFRSPDGTASFLVAGYWNNASMSDGTIENEYNDAVADYGYAVQYKILKSNYFVISGTKSGKIFYHVTKWLGDIGVTAILEYDESKEDSYNQACGTILKSLTLT